MQIDRELIILYADKIIEIFENCDDIQNSNESEYTKRCAKLSAYEDILDWIRSDHPC